ncbi:MAG: hypothetical protein WA063_00675 [Minisyncoccia bacterium]
MDNADILKTEEETLKLLRKWSIENKKIRLHMEAQEKAEKKMFDILFKLPGSIDEVLNQSAMIFLKEIVEKHNFSQLIADSKKALELYKADRDFIENVEQRVKSFELEITRLARVCYVTEYDRIEDIEESLELKRESCFRESVPVESLLIVLMYSSRILAKRLSSLVVWLSYKNP